MGNKRKRLTSHVLCFNKYDRLKYTARLYYVQVHLVMLWTVNKR